MTPPKNWIPSPDEFATIVDAETGRQVADFGSPFISEEESLRNFKLALTAPKLLTKLQAVAELRRRWRSQHESETIDSIAYMDGLDELDIDAAIAEATSGPPEPQPPIVIEVRGGVVQDVLNVPSGIEYEIRDYDNPPDDSAESGRRP